MVMIERREGRRGREWAEKDAVMRDAEMSPCYLSIVFSGSLGSGVFTCLCVS